MYLSLNWIKNWVKVSKSDAKKIAQDLMLSTVEVEGMVDQAACLDGIVVGQIEEVTKHPQADRLQVCQVNLGKTTEQIVCGGDNVSKGMLVAVAKVGTEVLWHGEEKITLGKTKIRGIESNGMIVSASEVNLEKLFPPKSERAIIDLSDHKVRPGQDLADALGLDDVIIDIENKSINHRPDLWGQYGLARELAAIYRIKLKEYEIPSIRTKDQIKLKVTVQDKENCFRYTGLAISNVKVEPSPWWMQKQLEAVGIRPVNNIVDITNYVMYELGQPMHAFDASQIEGSHIVVKKAKKGDKFVTLDGGKHTLKDDTLMIADSKKLIAIAGVMGGQNSEINNETTDIILESANFKASSVRMTSMALSLRTESSSRFEKSLDPVMAETAIKRAAELVLQVCPEAHISSKLVDVNNNPFKASSIDVTQGLIDRKFGQEIPAKEIKDILTSLEFKVSGKAGKYKIGVPSWRATKDITIPEDIVEEVIRIYGLDKVEPSLPTISLQKPIYNVLEDEARDIRNWLAFSQGYDEVYNYPFTDQAWAVRMGLNLQDHIKVKDPVSPEQDRLNVSLLPNLFACAEKNMRWFEEFRIFELDSIFDKTAKSSHHADPQKKKYLPRQSKYLAGVDVSKMKADELFLQTKGLIESMMNYWQIDWQAEKINLPYSDIAFVIKSHDHEIGRFGLLSSDLFDSRKIKVNVAFWEMDFGTVVKYIKEKSTFKPLSKYPAVNRDMAILVDKEVEWSAINSEIARISSLIRHIEPFDVFAGKGIPEGKKSLAYHLEFRSDDRTLEAEDVDKLEKKILKVLAEKFKAKRR